MPKSPCTSRAKWKLEPGKPATSLAEHYRLDCDFGTPVIAIYKTGDSNDPIYLCDGHVAEVKPTAKKWYGVRLIEAQSTDSSNPKQSEDRPHTAEAAELGPSAPLPAEAAPSPATKKTAQAPIYRSSRLPARDLTYGNSAKALVDEAIWNLPAEGQLTIVRRRIGEYAGKLEAVLSASTARINVGEVIDKPFETAILEIIGNGALSETAKDAAIEQLGALQESINHGLNREITPWQAHRIACVIGERANWGAGASFAEELKPAYRAVYASLRNAIRAAVPYAHALDERLANLHAAKSDLENVPAAKLSFPVDRVSVAT